MKAVAVGLKEQKTARKTRKKTSSIATSPAAISRFAKPSSRATAGRFRVSEELLKPSLD